LSRKSEAENWGILSIAAHPGVCKSTEIVANGPGGGGLLSLLYSTLGRVFLPSVEEAVTPILYAATASKIKGGDYVGPKRVWELRDGVARSKVPDEAMNEEVAKRLWNISAKLTETEWLQYSDLK